MGRIILLMKIIGPLMTQRGKEMPLIDAHRINELLRTHPVTIEKTWKDGLAKHAEAKNSTRDILTTENDTLGNGFFPKRLP
jgi:hypothetical protein